MSFSTSNKIAIVGMGGLFPDAKNLDEYWNNIINKRVSIRLKFIETYYHGYFTKGKYTSNPG